MTQDSEEEGRRRRRRGLPKTVVGTKRDAHIKFYNSLSHTCETTI